MQLAAKTPILSIKQPWAELILRGRKKVEIRSWETSYRGVLLIHTGKTPNTDAMKRFQLSDLPLGVLVGWARLSGIRSFEPDVWRAWKDSHLVEGAFDEDRHTFGWIIKDATRFTVPVEMRGKVGLFYLDAEAQAKVESLPEAEWPSV